jgi:hypothetical protein
MDTTGAAAARDTVTGHPAGPHRPNRDFRVRGGPLSFRTTVTDSGSGFPWDANVATRSPSLAVTGHPQLVPTGLGLRVAGTMPRARAAGIR